MPWTHLLPPDTRAAGTIDPANDANAFTEALAALGAGQVVTNPAFAGGADPTGVADSTAAFQAALNAIPSAGGLLLIPPGTFLISASLTSSANSVDIRGSGAGSPILGTLGTTLRLAASSPAYANVLGNAGNATGWSVRDLTIDGNASNQAAGSWQGGVVLQNPPASTDGRHYVHNVHVENMTGDGIVVTGNQGRTRITDCVTDLCSGFGFVLAHDSEITGCDSGRSGIDGFLIQSGSNAMAGCKSWQSGNALVTAGRGTGASLLTVNLAAAGPSWAGSGVVGTAFSYTATLASPAVFTATANNYVSGQAVTLSGGSPPTGFTNGTTYYVTGLSGNTFNLAATQGGAGINSSSTGNGTVNQGLPFHVANGWGSGFHWVNISGASRSGSAIGEGVYQALLAQDNACNGFKNEGGGGLIVSGVADSNSNAGTSSGTTPNVQLAGWDWAANACIVDGTSMDDGGNTSHQYGALSISAGSARNRISLMMYGTLNDGSNMPPLTAASSQPTSSVVNFRGANGGCRVIAYTSPWTPDPFDSEVQEMSTVTAALTINAPALAGTNTTGQFLVQGMKLTIILVQDATGHAVTLNAAYKLAGSAGFSGAASAVTAITFIYDGTNWIAAGT